MIDSKLKEMLEVVACVRHRVSWMEGSFEGLLVAIPSLSPSPPFILAALLLCVLPPC